MEPKAIPIPIQKQGDRPQQSAAPKNLPTSLIDKGTSMPVSLLTKVVKRLRSRAARFAPKN